MPTHQSRGLPNSSSHRAALSVTPLINEELAFTAENTFKHTTDTLATTEVGPASLLLVTLEAQPNASRPLTIFSSTVVPFASIPLSTHAKPTQSACLEINDAGGGDHYALAITDDRELNLGLVKKAGPVDSPVTITVYLLPWFVTVP